jgi:hypothetical protein
LIRFHSLCSRGWSLRKCWATHAIFPRYLPFFSAGRVSQQWPKLSTWREFQNIGRIWLWVQGDSEIRGFSGKWLRENTRKAIEKDTKNYCLIRKSFVKSNV